MLWYSPDPELGSEALGTTDLSTIAVRVSVLTHAYRLQSPPMLVLDSPVSQQSRCSWRCRAGALDLLTLLEKAATAVLAAHIGLLGVPLSWKTNLCLQLSEAFFHLLPLSLLTPNSESGCTPFEMPARSGIAHRVSCMAIAPNLVQAVCVGTAY